MSLRPYFRYLIPFFLCMGMGNMLSKAYANDNPPPRAAFLERSRIKQLALSHSGEQLLYTIRASDRDIIWIENLADKRRKQLLVTTNIKSIDWSPDDSGFYIEMDDQLAYYDMKAQSASFIYRVDDALEERLLWRPNNGDGYLISQTNSEGDYFLRLIDPTGKIITLLSEDRHVPQIVFDRAGEWQYYKRFFEGKQEILNRKKERVFACDVTDSCTLLGPLAEGEGFYLKAHLSQNLWGIYALSAPDYTPQLIHQDPRALADLSDVHFAPTGLPDIFEYRLPTPRHYAGDRMVGVNLERIKAVLGESFHVESRHENRWLIRQYGPTLQRAKTYIFEEHSGELIEVLADERAKGVSLPEADLAAQEAIQFHAKDGRLIHAYLSQPKGRDSRSLPILLKVHGGPWSHSDYGYDAFTQFFVSRGYLVLDVNFRGSTGYGRDYVMAGRGEFGNGLTHQDLLDGVDYIASLGIGDPQNIAMMGHSYGGFMSLGASSYGADRIKVAIASAPPISLNRAFEGLKRNIPYVNGVPREAIIAALLTQDESPQSLAALEAKSPEAHLAETRRPLLILAGAQDEKVSVINVKSFALALEGDGKDVSLLIEERAGHHFDILMLREAWLYLSEALLANYLGSPYKTHPPHADLSQYLSETMRLSGPSTQGLY